MRPIRPTRSRDPTSSGSCPNCSTATTTLDAWHIVPSLSLFLTLDAGDVIITGTPPSVGMKPQVFLATGDVVTGDVVTLSIDGHGSQRNSCGPA